MPMKRKHATELRPPPSSQQVERVTSRRPHDDVSEEAKQHLLTSRDRADIGLSPISNGQNSSNSTVDHQDHDPFPTGTERTESLDHPCAVKADEEAQAMVRDECNETTSTPCQHSPHRTPSQDPHRIAIPSTIQDQPPLSHDDGGHCFGNFHNYYTFHPSSERMIVLAQPGGILDYIVQSYVDQHDIKNSLTDSKSLKYSNGIDKQSKPQNALSRLSNCTSRHFDFVDIGCNEGDLTMAIAHHLQHQWTIQQEPSSTLFSSLQVVGLDLDPLLIARAKAKWNTSTSSAKLAFSASADVETGEQNAASQVQPLLAVDFQVMNVLELASETSNVQLFSADLICLFSTSMWIHIHGGDDGLRQVLEMMCRSSRRFVLIEAQPSKCYRTAAIRYRRRCQQQQTESSSLQSPPQILPDVSIDRLQLRVNLEQSIEHIVKSQGYEHVQLKLLQCNQSNIDGERNTTVWNRTLRLFERKKTLA